ncbi:DUF1998 domain-containing protein [Alicyclobacillaceae bacterium I2511]|nr:DUF1998 domain-containing protein [Alicyclobacillaceae bacterium I2511]
MIPALVAQEWQATLLEYIDTIFPFRDDRLSAALLDFLRDPVNGMFHGPYVQARLPFRQVETGYESPLTALHPPFLPYEHQLKAFERLSSTRADGPQPTLVTTGTGSGKTESFLYPIVDHCIRMREAGQQGIKAIILYPMNALAQDQAKRLAGILHQNKATKSLLAGLYVGHGERATAAGGDVSRVMTAERLIEDRKLLRKFPPDILLTNYKMLDLLLLRKVDWPLWSQNGSETLRYLVLDELHTYDGVQSADIACLVRRLRGRLRIPDGTLCPVGTSATLGDGSEQAFKKLLDYAGTVFGTAFAREAIVQEARPALSEYLLPLHEEQIPDLTEELRPHAREPAADYVRRQTVLWFGAASAEDLPQRLRRHSWFHVLCRVASGDPVTWAKLVQRFTSEFDLRSEADAEQYLLSFLSVVSEAKWEGGIRPLLPIQVQVWVRELRGLVREIREAPSFSWSGRDISGIEDGVGEEQVESSVTSGYPLHFGSPAHQTAAFPMIVCNRCGASGWVTLRQTDNSERLLTNPADIIPAFTEPNRLPTPDRERIVYLYPFTESEPLHGHVQSAYLTPRADLLEREITDAIPVYVAMPYVHRPGFGGKRLGARTCPHCRQADAMLPVSMRRASIGATFAGHVLSSDHVEDPKVLSFVDSVQDSALLAGFIQHRAKNSLLRTALVRELRMTPAGATLADAIVDWPSVWRSSLGDRDFVRAFVEEDEDDEQIAGRYPRELKTWTDETWTRVLRFVSMRVLQEFGLHARLGRSLYQTGVATLQQDSVRMAQAVDLAYATLRERHPQLNQDGKLRDRVHGLALGILHRMVVNGGISHPLLDGFREGGGEPYLLSRDQNQDYVCSTRIPSFYTTGRPSDGLDSLFGAANSWLALYMKATLTLPLEETGFVSDVDAGDVVHTLFIALQEAKVVDVRHHGADSTYGLRPDALNTATTTARLVCTKCHAEVTVATEDVPIFVAHVRCIAYRCGGTLVETERRRRRYATRLYEESRVLPPAVKEHSSLVPNEERRLMEQRFETGKPQPLNVLICTPTMEMGIDIGDLSTIFLAGVPPTLSNRVQRMGRAGRSSGRSLIGQVVREQPHDQYFWESPVELLAGKVESPTCPMDAPEVLKRHLRAFLFDAWIRDRPEAEIPRQASRVVLEEASAQGFPTLFYAYADANREALWDHFSELFQGHLRAESVIELKQFFFEGEWSHEIDEVIRERREEEREARRHLERLNRRLQEREFQSQEGIRTEEYQELERTVYQARARHYSLLRESTTEWWTNEGLLPNYTFPERPVTIRRYRRRGVVEAFDRPQREALRELAPGRVFYAHGRRTPVTQLGLGGHEQGLERWRLCPVCQHMEREVDVPVGPCPSCGTPEWRDTGQIVQMVRLRRVSARDSSQEEKIRDDQEERTRSRAQVRLFFEFTESPGMAAELRNRLFGFEWFSRVTVREINFGEPNRDGGERQAAGAPVPKNGFTICEKCGAAAMPDGHGGQLPIRHVRGFACDRVRVHDVSEQMVNQGTNERRTTTDEHQAHVYLYREFQSEVLRFLLPVGEAAVEERSVNWMAALRLGLRQILGGSARQIEMAFYDEPLGGNGAVRARYIALYDSVPGGTGYLRQLAQPEDISRLIQAAYRALSQCSCQNTQKKACYRCLLRYESQYQQAFLSRRLAVELLQPLAGIQPEDWKIVERLQANAIAGRPEMQESDLEYLTEQKLVEHLAALDRSAQVQTDALSIPGRYGVRITVARNGNGFAWDLIRQGLPSQDAALFHTRPDFLAVPVIGEADESVALTRLRNVKPVAIYVDGETYHIGQGQFDRFPRDVLQREALRRSGEYRVFSITRRDIIGDNSELPGMNPYPEFPQKLTSFATALQLRQPAVSIWRGSGLDLLARYLMNPDESEWEQFSQVVGLAIGQVTKPQYKTTAESAVGVLDRVQVAEEKAPYSAHNVETGGKSAQSVVLAEHHFAAGQSVAAVMSVFRPSQHVFRFDGVVRLEDDTEFRNKPLFVDAWRTFLHWSNILQWLPDVRFVTTRSLREYRDEWRQLDILRPVHGFRVWMGDRHVERVPEWLQWVGESFRTSAMLLIELGLPEPQVGYELMDGGRVVAEAELAWPDERVAVFATEMVDDAEVATRLGWQVWDLSWVQNTPDARQKLMDEWSSFHEGRE